LCPLHSSPGQFSIQSVRLVGVVANETFWERADKPLCEGRMHQRDFMRRGALNVNSDGKALPNASVLGGREASVDERFLLRRVEALRYAA
jgi:hypothetical protein